jgi:hypothetical protein
MFAKHLADAIHERPMHGQHPVILGAIRLLVSPIAQGSLEAVLDPVNASLTSPRLIGVACSFAHLGTA